MKKTVSGIMLLVLAISMSTLALSIQTVKANVSSHGETAQATDILDWWPTFRHDLDHTGYSTSTGPTTNKLCGAIKLAAGSTVILPSLTARSTWARMTPTFTR